MDPSNRLSLAIWQSGSLAMTVIYLVRHAHVHNPRRLVYGHLPGFGLSRRGIAEARALGRRLRSEQPSLIYSSPLQRARETAQLIRGELAGKPRIVYREKLRETEVARLWQGTPYYRVPFRFPRQWVAWIARPHRIRFAETSVQLAQRMEEILREIAHAHPGETVVVVSHATSIKSLVFRRLRRPWSGLHAARLANARGFRVEIDRQGIHEITPL